MKVICRKRLVPCFMTLNVTHHPLRLQSGNWGKFVGYPEAPGRFESPPFTSGNTRISWHGHNSAASLQTDPPTLPGLARQPGKTKGPNWSTFAIQLNRAHRRKLNLQDHSAIPIPRPSVHEILPARTTPDTAIPRRCSSTCRQGTIVKSLCRSMTANFPLTREIGSR